MELAAKVPDEHHAASSTTSSPNSILDRKRELKAIPGSFSYNLGRRGSGVPPRLDLSLGHSPSRSVKSIVAWIESSSAAGQQFSRRRSASSDDDGATLRSDASSYTLHGSLKVSPSRTLDPDTTGVVDSDCPTFLDYQKYFAQESLARCLDEQQRAKLAAARPSPERRDDDDANADGGTIVRFEEQWGNGIGGHFAEDECAVTEKRSPADVAALYNSIRQQLWIPDEELESHPSETSSVLADQGSVVLA